jgi:hypothetical protein
MSKYAAVAFLTALMVVLAGTHWKAYHAGGAAVQAKWDKDASQRAQQALQAEQAARKREQDLATQKRIVEERYANDKRKAAAAAAGARSELDRLRSEISRPACTGADCDSAAARGVDAGAVERQLLGQCAAALVGVAQDADRLAATVIGLQAYVRSVCQAPQPGLSQ